MSTATATPTVVYMPVNTGDAALVLCHTPGRSPFYRCVEEFRGRESHERAVKLAQELNAAAARGDRP